MKRADGLYDISRRQFVLGAVAVGGALAACSSDSGNTTPDGPTADPDAPTGGSCTTNALDVGAPTTFVTGKPILVASNKAFIMRDANGLYALSAACTHEGQTLCVGTNRTCAATGTDLFCTRHGAVFKFDGTVMVGPASVALPHFALCLLPNGNVGVVTTMIVAATTRLSA